MKPKSAIYPAILIGLLVFFLNSCSKKETIKTAPTVTLSSVTNITSTTASSGGVVTTDGGSTLTARGVCWSITQNPTISDSKTSDGSGSGSYSSTLIGLAQGTTYYLKAYGINSIGTGYSDQTTFTTLALAPVLTTTNLSAVTATTATGGGNVTNDGGSAVTVRGVCWSINQNPTISDAKTSDGTGTGIFSSTITGLTPGVTYNIRAYATNSVGTSYGNQVTATALATGATLTTAAVSAITSGGTTSGGNITSDGGAPVTARGVCWSTNQNPTITSSKTTDGTGSGTFTSAITGLNPGTIYYLRAYATNSVGTSYGSQITVATLAIIPALTTASFTAITSVSASGGGTITSDGGSVVTARGVCWSTNQNPTFTDNKTTDGTGSGTFVSSITGLTPGATYYIRAYATNSIGTAYGTQLILTTSATLPVLTTTAASSVASSSAASGGTITSDGGSAVTARGVCWSTNQSPVISDNKTTDGAGTGVYPSSVTGLTPGATYYIRAYATNSMGTAYGNQITINALANLPNLTTATSSAVTATGATSGGNIINDGGATTIVRGVCWSTFQNPTTVNSKTADGTGTGTFVSSITGLTPGATYYIRAYATNSIGTAYGNQITITALANLPSLTTATSSAVTATGATSGGNIVNDGGAAVTVRGVCWSTSQNPTTSNSITTDGTGTGNFTSSVTGLTPGATYYIRAYAINSIGTSYGNQLTMTALSTFPLLSTTSISAITSSSALSGGTILSDGGSSLISRGICWSTNQNPTISDNKTNDGTGIGTFISSLTGLSPGVTYYVRAYATNGIGTSYGNQLNTTTSTIIPSLSTTIASITTSSSSTSGGLISGDGGSSVTGRGVCWSINQNPTIGNSKTNDGAGTGSFTSYITGLSPGTTYYIKAYATNNIGTAYGNQISITTQAILPVISTNLSVTDITISTATCGGIIASDGGSPVTVRGTCWSENTNPTVNDAKTTYGSGIGSFNSSLTSLLANTVYYLRAYATNSVGTAYGDQISFKTLPSVSETVNDTDGNIYHTVTIGTQVWMIENLKTTKYRDGTNILNLTDDNSWGTLNQGTPGYCWYQNNVSNKNIYGALYNWYIVNSGELCPVGWHVPSSDEWSVLVVYLGGENLAGFSLKEAGNNHWYTPNNANNTSGFTALPGGYRETGYNSFIGYRGYWWSTVAPSSSYSLTRGMGLYYDQSAVRRDDNFASYYGLSVRCIRD